MVVSTYLRREGVFVVTTPNRLVFSAGMEPSPINLTHIREMNETEFRCLLGEFFDDVNLWGMRFREPVRRREHARLVRAACHGYRLLGRWWWNKYVNRSYRWLLKGELFRVLAGSRYHRWQASDFEFVRSAADAIWFYAICRGPKAI